jgi:biopolymer transport protein ExbB
MGNPSNFEGGNNEGTLNTLGQVYRGAVVPVLLGMLLMVLVFSIERFSLYLRQLVKLIGHFMTKIQASIKQGEIDEAIVS